MRKEGRKEGRGEERMGGEREGSAAWPVVVVVLVLAPDTDLLTD